MPDTWHTWAEAGERFGLSPDAIRMRARRLGWRTTPGNDGRTRVLVPEDAEVQPRARAPEASPDRASEQRSEFGRLLDLLSTAEERTERAENRANIAERRADLAEQRADQAQVRADAAQARADQAEAALAAERGRADTLRDQIDGLRAELGTVHATASAAGNAAAELRQAEEARRRLGRLARIWAAWRGA